MHTSEVLKNIILDQRADLKQSLSDSHLVARDATPQVLDLLRSKLVTVVLGVRRSGKSTLCVQSLRSDSMAYLNFDDERLLHFTAADLNTLLEAFFQLDPHYKIFVFDEIQNVHGWELFVNRLQRKGLKVVITGSNAHLLGRDLATHLTGRQVSLELFPFSFAEYLRFFNIEARTPESTEEKSRIKAKLKDYLLWGGFPDVVQGESPGIYLRELFDKIISRDVIQRHAVRNYKSFREMGLNLIQQSAARITFQKLARSYGFKSVHTAKNYLGFLVECYLLQELLPYSNKLKERMTLPRKIYSIDLGMVNALRTKPTSDWGAILETSVFLHFRRLGKEMYYYGGAGDAEVDFVLCEGGKPVVLCQACWSFEEEKTQKREIRALLSAARELRVKELWIILGVDGESSEITVDGRKIVIRPLWDFLLGGGKIS